MRRACLCTESNVCSTLESLCGGQSCAISLESKLFKTSGMAFTSCCMDGSMTLGESLGTDAEGSVMSQVSTIWAVI